MKKQCEVCGAEARNIVVDKRKTGDVIGGTMGAPVYEPAGAHTLCDTHKRKPKTVE